MSLPHISLSSCPKGYTHDLDKAIAPEDTVRRVRARLEAARTDILAETRRVDIGRLGIPVYLSVCGAEARRVMPTRKQMGKGSSPAQAQASALMELMERYAFFSFWERRPFFHEATWSEAEARFGSALLPIEEIVQSVHDSGDAATARRLMDLRRWQFFPATRLGDGETVWLPLDWFKMLGEFNGTSSGNSAEESLLQGLSELVERHVCCHVDGKRLETPTVTVEEGDDAVLLSLLHAFARNGIKLVLKDFSLGMPLPTVGAVAWDPATFPESSEIVFTAGTAATPAKAAVRAVTEVAQLAGDFCTRACYEASGLSKFERLEDIDWLLRGPSVPLRSLPSVEHDDIREELRAAVAGLAPLQVYAVETTHPDLGIAAHYTMVPGLDFRERDRNQSIGLFVGRKLAEEADEADATRGLAVLEACHPQAHYLPFFKGMLAMRRGDNAAAHAFFREAAPCQPDGDAFALASFYAGYVLTLDGRWNDALPFLREAFERCPSMKEYGNLAGVALFKMERYDEAASYFSRVLHIDKGSAMDWANLGMCHKRRGRDGEAGQCLRRALSLDASLDFARRALEELETPAGQ